MRQSHTLDSRELFEFQTLIPEQGKALSFWARVAYKRGLDPATIISDAPAFTGLPRGHTKHWCWPLKLVNSQPPKYRE